MCDCDICKATESFFPVKPEMYGVPFKAICLEVNGYYGILTIGKEYTIVIDEPHPFDGTPFCSFIGDRGKNSLARLSRFRKVKE